MDTSMAIGEAISNFMEKERVSRYRRPIFTKIPVPPTMANFTNSSNLL